MKRNWQDIKWIFEPDGALRDMYVQEVSLGDWEKLIDWLNKKHRLQFGISGEEAESNRIDKAYVLQYLTDLTGDMESKSTTIDLQGIKVNCHFFLSEQIEFDVDPKEVGTMEDFEKMESFLLEISALLNNQVTLTGENDPTFPLMKLDVHRRINKALTQQEAQAYWGKRSFIKSQWAMFKAKFQMKFFPARFQENLLKSATEPYQSTRKSKNVW